MFGYLKSYKGIDLVIEAAGLLRDKFRGKARFVIAGTDTNYVLAGARQDTEALRAIKIG